MKLYPSLTKFRKYFKIRKNKKVSSIINLQQSYYGIKAKEAKLISDKFLDKLSLSLRRKLKRQGKIWFRCIPFISVTSKPLEVRMGKGKGNHSYWVYPLKKGQIFLEIIIKKNIILFEKIVRVLQKKLPFKFIVIKKRK